MMLRYRSYVFMVASAFTVLAACADAGALRNREDDRADIVRDAAALCPADVASKPAPPDGVWRTAVTPTARALRLDAAGVSGEGFLVVVFEAAGPGFSFTVSVSDGGDLSSDLGRFAGFAVGADIFNIALAEGLGVPALAGHLVAEIELRSAASAPVRLRCVIFDLYTD